MSARRRRKRRGLLGAIIADPYRKLAAIALAIGLWYYLDNQVHEPREVPVTLTAKGVIPPPGGPRHKLDVQLGTEDYFGERFLAGDEELSTVVLHLRGPKSTVRDVLGSPGSGGSERLIYRSGSTAGA